MLRHAVLCCAVECCGVFPWSGWPFAPQHAKRSLVLHHGQQLVYTLFAVRTHGQLHNQLHTRLHADTHATMFMHNLPCDVDKPL